MKVLIRNKAISFGGSSRVLNENKELVYNVKGKFLSLRRKKRICDLGGNVLYRVQNQLFSIFNHSAYILDPQKQKIAKVTRKLFDVKGNYIIECGNDEMMVEGHFFGNESRILKNGTPIGTLKRDINLIADHFTLEANEEDIPFLIALVIAVDNISDKKSRQTK